MEITEGISLRAGYQAGKLTGCEHNISCLLLACEVFLASQVFLFCLFRPIAFQLIIVMKPLLHTIPRFCPISNSIICLGVFHIMLSPLTGYFSMILFSGSNIPAEKYGLIQL